jgi:GNAT superfamily N-acetyltransferase
MTSIELRIAAPDDAVALAGLRWEWSAAPGAEGRDGFVEAFAAWMRATDATHRCVVADRGGELVGMAWIALTPRPPVPGAVDRRSADLQSVYVRPQLRGSGVGSRLVEAAIELARGSGALHMTVHATAEAADYYRRFGFAVEATLAQLQLRP